MHPRDKVVRGIRLRLALLAAGAVFAFTQIGTDAQSAEPCGTSWILIGEDDDYYYCVKELESHQIQAVQKYYTRLKREGVPGLLGDEWRFRKKVIDHIGCMARHRWAYVYGGRITWPEECVGLRGGGVDCSGAVAQGFRFSACFFAGYARVAFKKHIAMETSAAGQAKLFRKNAAFIPASGNPLPGDAIFFHGTWDRNKDGRKDSRDGITHVGIFLGRGEDGRVLIVHASSAAGRVIVTRATGFLRQRIAGYGDLSKLYMRLRQP